MANLSFELVDKIFGPYYVFDTSLPKNNQTGGLFDKNNYSSWNSLNRQAKFLFDKVAEEYHRYRPGYPPELVEDIISLSGIPVDEKISEIGAGTGIAT